MQEQGKAGQHQPQQLQQQPNVGERQQLVPRSDQQQQIHATDPTEEELARLMSMLRQYPYYAQALDPVTGKLVFPRLAPTPMRPLDVAQEHPFNYTTPQITQFYNNRN